MEIDYDAINHDATATMRELYQSAGYDTDELLKLRDVTPEVVVPGSVVVAYTVMTNYDLDGPKTTYNLDEFPVGPEDVFKAEEVREETDGMVYYPDDSQVEWSLRWAYLNGGLGKFKAIAYGDIFEEDDEGTDDKPGKDSWNRAVGSVRGMSDDFLRFRGPE